MSEQNLKASLAELRAQLARRENLDAETRRELADVADTIEDVLNQESPDYREAHASVQDVALRFEARHPAFAQILSQVTDALAKLGI